MRGSNMKTCPKCGKQFMRLLAVSRIDNKTMICDLCGTREALDDLEKATDAPEKEIAYYKVFLKDPTCVCGPFSKEFATQLCEEDDADLFGVFTAEEYAQSFHANVEDYLK